MAEEIVRRPRCGKCHSLGAYRDDDRSNNGAIFICCPVCGNRYPGGSEFYMEVIVKKPCKNCHRVMAMVTHGMCFVCSKAYDSVPDGPGSEEAREIALATVKKRIEDAGGNLSTGFRAHKPKIAPAAPTPPLPKTEPETPAAVISPATGIVLTVFPDQQAANASTEARKEGAQSSVDNAPVSSPDAASTGPDGKTSPPAPTLTVARKELNDGVSALGIRRGEDGKWKTADSPSGSSEISPYSMKDSERKRLNLFIDECCILDPGFETEAKEIYRRYSIWHEKTYPGTTAMSFSSFEADMDKRFPLHRPASGYLIYHGVLVRSDAVPILNERPASSPAAGEEDQSSAANVEKKQNIPAFAEGSCKDSDCPVIDLLKNSLKAGLMSESEVRRAHEIHEDAALTQQQLLKKYPPSPITPPGYRSSVPDCQGLYMAKSRDDIHYDLIVDVRGLPPMLYIHCAFDRGFQEGPRVLTPPPKPFEICQSGPIIRDESGSPV